MADYVLNKAQQKLVEDNLGLVGAVIRDKFCGTRRIGYYTKDDLYQIGCEGLCRAAYSYKESKKGVFATYAYRVIYNKILDAFRYSTVRTQREAPFDQEVLERRIPDVADGHVRTGDAFAAFEKVLAGSKESIRKGAEAIRLRVEGYGSDEICLRLGAKQSTVRTWITRTRRYLQENPELASLADAMDLC